MKRSFFYLLQLVFYLLPLRPSQALAEQSPKERFASARKEGEPDGIEKSARNPRDGLQNNVVIGQRPAETQEDAERMIRDIYHLVQSRENRLWYIDSEEVKALQTDILVILCTAASDTRRRVRETFAQDPNRSVDLRQRWLSHDKDLSALSEPLRLHRAWVLLESGLMRTPYECPFWLEPNVPYVEKHRPTRQGFLTFDGGGMLNLLPEARPLRLGFGGSGRLTGGYGLNEKWILKSRDFVLCILIVVHD